MLASVPEPLTVALVGPLMQENLALQYLGAALQRAGHEPVMVAYDGRQQVARAVDETLALAPTLVGIAVPFQYCIAECFAFAEMLRDRGYAGHITCGGHVPTFCYAEMLRDCPALSSAVRHEGEETLVEVADRCRQGRPIRDVPGLVWRTEQGIAQGPKRPQVRKLDELAPPLRGDDPYRVAGVPVAFVITARGCIGECDYCSIRAFEKDSGGPPFRLRDTDAVASEIADLYHRMGARVCFVQDDIFVLPSERRTIERMDALRSALDARGVEDMAFWIKGRPEHITGPVLEATRRMGGIHIFMGIENASAERLAYLGRTHKPEHNRRALELCQSHEVHPSFNFMLFDPDCSLEDVALTLDFAEQHLGMPYNYCRTEIYSGTGLLARLREQGRLLGDYRSYGYVMRDPRAELMFRMLRVCLQERAFAFDSLLNKLISLSFARQIHAFLFPSQLSRAVDNQVQALMVDVHRDTLEVLREVLTVASDVGVGAEQAVERALEIGLAAGARDLQWHAEAQRLWDMLHARGIQRSA